MSWSTSPPLRRESAAHAPTIPSPLNPLSPHLEKHEPRRQRSQNYVRLGPRKVSGPQSPTERLMRQKAAVAWRSMALRNNVTNCRPMAQEDQRPIRLPLFDDDWNTEMDLAEDEYLLGGDIGIPPDQTMTTATRQRYDADFGILETDVEKQALVVRPSWDTNWGSAFKTSEAQTCPYKPKRRLFTTCRAFAALGVLCIIGAWTALHTAGDTRNW